MAEEIKTTKQAYKAINTLMKLGKANLSKYHDSNMAYGRYEISEVQWQKGFDRYSKRLDELNNLYTKPLKRYFEKNYNKKHDFYRSAHIDDTLHDILNGYPKGEGTYQVKAVYDWLEKEAIKEQSVKQQLRKASRSKTKLPTQSQLSKRAR